MDLVGDRRDQRPALRVEDRDPVVADVGDEQPSAAVDGYTTWQLDVSLTDLPEVPAALVEDGDGVAVGVGDERAAAEDRHILRLPEDTMTDDAHTVAAPVEDADVAAPGVGHPEPAPLVEGHPHRGVEPDRPCLPKSSRNRGGGSCSPTLTVNKTGVASEV